MQGAEWMRKGSSLTKEVPTLNPLVQVSRLSSLWRGELGQGSRLDDNSTESVKHDFLTYS